MSIEWLDHKGKKILYIKYSGLSNEDMLKQIREATKIIVDNKDKEILSLTDMTNCFVNDEFLELAKNQGKISLPLTKKAAILGITGIKKLLLRTMNNFVPKPRVPFETIDQAKDWLVE